MSIAENPLAGKRILVVEDDYLVVTDLITRLKAMGVDAVGPAASAEDALALLDSEPDLSGALLDVNLGGRMVFPLADELARRALPFVLATGYGRDIIPYRYADRGLLEKPFDDRSLEAALFGLVSRPMPSLLAAGRNRILNALPEADLREIAPLLRSVSLGQGAAIEERNRPVREVYFPIDCVISMIAHSPRGISIETGLIGREGFTGFGLASGDSWSPYEMVNQISGTALVMPAEDFAGAMARFPALRQMAGRFGRSLGIQVSYTALANGRYDLARRLARWLLMVDDRVDGNSFTLTHNYLSVMLGVRRPGVTNVLHILEGERLIRSLRSEVVIVNREGLLAFAGDSYGVPEEEYRRIMGFALHAGAPAGEERSWQRRAKQV
ncbi:helix-turn-helix domain-containing protein [Shinella sp. BYT-45]|uniref:helix-turn-helix domain-containing protein n=1 Tax=Shinella sp. BYT-45 TaxID=3377377 RepID=UPI0039812FB3